MFFFLPWLAPCYVDVCWWLKKPPSTKRAGKTVKAGGRNRRKCSSVSEVPKTRHGIYAAPVLNPPSPLPSPPHPSSACSVVTTFRPANWPRSWRRGPFRMNGAGLVPQQHPERIFSSLEKIFNLLFKNDVQLSPFICSLWKEKEKKREKNKKFVPLPPPKKRSRSCNLYMKWDV